jgi:hypothetical protein
MFRRFKTLETIPFHVIGQVNQQRARGVMMGAMVIGGDKFSGKPGDWADVKTEIVAMIENAGYSYVTKNGRHPSSSRRTGNHDNIEVADLEKHVKKMWPTQLRSIRSQTMMLFIGT